MTDLMAQIEAEQELARSLDAHAGRWVAVKHHQVVADADTLTALLDKIDVDSVDGVFQVAEQGTACFF